MSLLEDEFWFSIDWSLRNRCSFKEYELVDSFRSMKSLNPTEDPSFYGLVKQKCGTVFGKPVIAYFGQPFRLALDVGPSVQMCAFQ